MENTQGDMLASPITPSPFNKVRRFILMSDIFFMMYSVRIICFYYCLMACLGINQAP
jgi:hypothetical protein